MTASKVIPVNLTTPAHTIPLNELQMVPDANQGAIMNETALDYYARVINA